MDQRIGIPIIFSISKLNQEKIPDNIDGSFDIKDTYIQLYETILDDDLSLNSIEIIKIYFNVKGVVKFDHQDTTITTYRKQNNRYELGLKYVFFNSPAELNHFIKSTLCVRNMKCYQEPERRTSGGFTTIPEQDILMKLVR